MSEQIEGRNAVLEAFRSGKCVDKLFILDGCQDGPVRTIAREARKTDTIINYVSKERLDQLSETHAHQGVIAQVAAYDYSTVDEILARAEEKGEAPFLIILDNVEDPHNLGAIIRTANLAGAHGVIIPKRRAVGLTSTVAKTSAGAINYTPVAKVTNIVRTIEELKEKIDSLPKGSIPTLITEVSHRIERMNLLESTEHKADVSGIINVALSELEFEFKKGISEELRIIVNDIRERCERVQAEFEANFDRTEDKYVILADEFREYFRKKGFVPQSTQDAKESIDYMDAVMKKIREINRRNNILKKKYQGDERFVRIHKRIEEENEKRERPIISKAEYEIAESLSKMKREIDNRIYLDINIIANENSFKRDTLAMIGHQLIDLGINASISDRKFINNLIANEYINQYNQVHLR